jgi:hypothetical protein
MQGGDCFDMKKSFVSQPNRTVQKMLEEDK